MSLLVRRILCQMPRRFSTTGALHAQGTQDDPSSAANFLPDFSFPQGLQGEIANGAGKDAICQLWLEKCKLYGYNNCEERLEQLLKTAPNPK
ncbi:unnamed protein product [Adineta ricciae]|uniref:Uncharacterized protein n=1 Tax=Adineta ricciae TaxID=249248 RepID=A0A814Q369_ADIRI|nr:unnamed protein product [Adineta ricciae]